MALVTVAFEHVGIVIFFLTVSLKRHSSVVNLLWFCKGTEL